MKVLEKGKNGPENSTGDALHVCRGGTGGWLGELTCGRAKVKTVSNDNVYQYAA
ncbi:hypothetical protein [Variovorax paradoxus]|uniref:hypothetical protein n=1 Tax=Variovorax paradoxus TaxID=34073 RepID=UPI001ABC53F3